METLGNHELNSPLLTGYIHLFPSVHMEESQILPETEENVTLTVKTTT